MSSNSYEVVLREHKNNLYGDGNPDEGSGVGGLRPFFTISQSDDDEKIKWLKGTLEVLQDEQQPRAIEQLCNMRFYNGIQSMSDLQSRSQSRALDRSKVKRSARIVLNDLRDVTNQSVARVTRFPAQINTFPWTNEYSDKIGAKFSKRVIDHLWYKNEIDSIYTDVVHQAKICGESFLFVEWDPFSGDLDKEVAKLLEDERYKKEGFTTAEGERIMLETIQRIGDVSYCMNDMPWFVFHEPQVKWRDVNYIFRAKLKHIDEVRFENKGMAFDKTDALEMYGNREEAVYGPGFKYGEWVIQYEFWHRRHRFLDKGRYIKFVGDQILVDTDLPYSHGQLPVARFTDLDDPSQAHGVSFYADLKLPQVMYNNIMSLIYRNIAIAGHPKLFVPSGSTNMYSMANGPFVVEYDGPQEPKIASFSTVGAEVFNYAGNIMNKIQQYSGTFGISRGESIPNARAQSMLAFYEEQEEQREGLLTAKYKAFIKKTAQLTLGVAGDYYEPDDGRILRIMGRNNQYKVRKLEDITLIRKPVDVKVERTTALSESKQGRIDQISTLSSMPLNGEVDAGKPGLFTREQILSMLEIGDTETFYSMVTASVDKARSENEDMFEGIPVGEPQRFENHLTHWNEHYLFIQSPEFTDTERVPERVRKLHLNHLITHEMLMYEKARENATFAKMLLENINFPAIFEIGQEPTVLQLVMAHETPPPTPQEQAEMAQEEQRIQQEAEEVPAKDEKAPAKETETPEAENVEEDVEEIDAEDVVEIAEDVAYEVAERVVAETKGRSYQIESETQPDGTVVARIIYDDGEEKVVTINKGNGMAQIDMNVVN